MLDRGLVDELVSLQRAFPLSGTMPSMRSVGYRQAWQHLSGQFDRAELLNRGIFATRQLAKRQLTWLRTWRSPLAAFDCFDVALAGKVREAVLRAMNQPQA
jgi:tRNA dimethylallyltransferase